MRKVPQVWPLVVFVIALLTAGCGVDAPATSPTSLPAHGTPARLDLSASPGTGANGGTARLQARVQDAYFTVLPDVPVTFAADAGSLDTATATTDANGVAVVALTAAPGTVKVHASAGTVQAPELAVTIQPVNVFVPPPPGPPPPPEPPIPPPAVPQPRYTVSLTATPASVTAGTPTTLAATVTPLNNAPAVTAWVWDCDTATASTDFTTANSAPCTYAIPGTFTASVRVTGGTAVGTATTTVTVTAAAVPSYTVTLTATPSTVAAGSPTTLKATVTRVNGAPPPTSFEWDCDTTTPTIDSTAQISTACTYPTPGLVEAKVTVKNSSGSITSSATVDVSVTAAVAPTPVVTVHCAQPTPPALKVNCNVSATLDGATVATSAITSVDWDWADTTTTPNGTAVASHTYTAANTYVVAVRNVTVTGTTAKGSGSAAVPVQ
jgi:PKD repeat protein